jgi:hypothetical protein
MTAGKIMTMKELTKHVGDSVSKSYDTWSALAQSPGTSVEADAEFGKAIKHLVAARDILGGITLDKS